MPLLSVILGIFIILLLVSKLRWNIFIALLITTFIVGAINGMNVNDILKSVIKGIGDTTGTIVLIIVFGAMLGKLIEESGAAHTITYWFISLFGEKRLPAALMLTGFAIGLPMIYNASFLVLIPLVYTFAATTRFPLIYLGIPLCATLSVAHGYLPPHPAPTAVAAMIHANVNLTLLYGIIVGLPAVLLAGPFLARFFKKMIVLPPRELFTPREFQKHELPKIGVSLFTVLIPIILMVAGAVFNITVGGKSRLASFFSFISDPNFALFFAVMVGIYTLGTRRGKSMDQVMKSLMGSVGSVALIILIIAAGGAFKQMLIDSGIGKYIEMKAQTMNLSPLLLAWGTAALLRLALGSATVATITAAGMMVPLVSGMGVPAELVVLATGSGSLMFSHFNDTGFWMFKEYFNLSIKQTFMTWTLMECIVSTAGLIGVLILNWLIF
jgi:gluconate transporter